jgi:hypothetical protein
MDETLTLEKLEFLFNIEKIYGIEIKDEEVESLHTIEDLLNLVEKKQQWYYLQKSKSKIK